MAKVEPIIEWQQDRQRTTQEVVDRMQELIDADNMDSVLVLYDNKNQCGYLPGNKKRSLTRASILWMVEQFKYWWTIDVFEND